MKKIRTHGGVPHWAQYFLSGAGILSLVLAVSLFVLPLLFLFAKGSFAGRQDLLYESGISSAFEIFSVISYTFEEALGSVLIASLIGIPGAWLLAKKNIPLKKILRSFAAVPLSIPPLIIALGYISTFGMSGIWNRILMEIFSLEEPPLTFLYSFWGIIITQGFYNFPIVMATVADAWSSLDKVQEESAALLGASRWKIFWSVTFFKLLPAIVSACIPVFIFCFFSFMIVLLFGTAGGTTLEIAIYHAGRSVLNLRETALLALVETLSALAAIWIYSRAEKKAERNRGISFSALQKNGRECSAQKMNLIEKILALAFFMAVAVFFASPIISIAAASFTSRTGGEKKLTLYVWKHLFAMKGFLPSLKNTMLTATATACLCTLCGTTLAFLMRMQNSFISKQNTALKKIIPMIPMAVSSVVMGLSFTVFFRHANALHLVLAQTALSWPFAFRQVYAQAVRVPQDTLDAAKILSRHRTDAVFNVLLPYCSKGILSSLGFCFAMSAGDATLPLILAIQKFDTLALYTYRLAGSYKFSEASACALMLGLLCMGMFTLSRRMEKTK